ncbi:MAG: hypothetical protein ACK40G_15240 [Cytophagaceae bacterium]
METVQIVIDKKDAQNLYCAISSYINDLLIPCKEKSAEAKNQEMEALLKVMLELNEKII